MKKTKQPIKAVIYCRTASTPAGGRGDVLLAQEVGCKVYAAKHGLKIIDVFHDRGKSGMHTNHPGLQAMMQLLQKTSAPHYVLIRDITRLARDFNLCAELQEECEQLGHKVIAVDDHQACKMIDPAEVNLLIQGPAHPES